MPGILITAAVCIAVVLLLPSGKKKKKKGNGTDVWENTPSMRIAQFADYISRKLKDLIGG